MKTIGPSGSFYLKGKKRKGSPRNSPVEHENTFKSGMREYRILLPLVSLICKYVLGGCIPFIVFLKGVPLKPSVWCAQN